MPRVQSSAADLPVCSKTGVIMSHCAKGYAGWVIAGVPAIHELAIGAVVVVCSAIQGGFELFDCERLPE